MNHATGKFIAVVLMAGLLGLPAGLSAKARRGALVVLTKVDGAEVKGELVSVKPDHLLLLKSGDVLTIPRGRVHSVTIMRRSRMASGALTGFTAGVLAGVSWGISYGDSHAHGIPPSVQAGAFAGGLGLIIGMAVSRGEKVESVISFAGLTGPDADERWNALRAYSLSLIHI
jgi:hypothetical protein